MADLFLIIGSFLLSLQAVITGIGSLVMVYYVPFGRGGWFSDRLLVGLGWVTGFCISVALLVVFQRVTNLSRRSP